MKEETVKRREFKYYLPEKEYLVVSHILRRGLKADPHNKSTGGYMIRSVYFDSYGDDSFEDKMGGFEQRAKYRIRVYDAASQEAKFEIKQKENDVVIKESVTISRAHAQELLKGNFDVMLDYRSQTLNKAYCEFKKKHYRPVVMVQYSREAYICDVNKIRIVFDKFIKSSPTHFNIFQEDMPLVQHMLTGMVVLEVKFNDYLPPWIKSLLAFNSFERSAISKYCIGRLENYNTRI